MKEVLTIRPRNAAAVLLFLCSVTLLAREVASLAVALCARAAGVREAWMQLAAGKVDGNASDAQCMGAGLAWAAQR